MPGSASSAASKAAASAANTAPGPIRAEAPVEQRLSNGIGRRDRASVADRPPVTTGPFGYQRMFGSDPRPFPQAMHHRHRILAQFLGRAKQQLTRLAAVSGEDSRRREQIPDIIAAGHLALPL